MRFPTLKMGLLLAALTLGTPASAAPSYDFDRAQLDSILANMKAWLPGAWDSFPQVWYDRNVTMPADGEHAHWHRSFALIDAPQVGETVFYGQINVGGPDGPILGRSQVLYKAYIDEQRGAVSIIGQPIVDAHLYQNLHQHPELWDSVRMPDEAAAHCVFVWRRQRKQIFGVMDAKTPEGRLHGPGTCSYIAGGGQEFVADSEWVLSPDELWLYDTNTMGGALFIGRKDRTHLKMYRTTPYACAISAAGDEYPRELVAHDRGYTTNINIADDTPQTVTLLRAWYPAQDGAGLADELRLTLNSESSGLGKAEAKAEPLAEKISLSTPHTNISCTKIDRLLL